MLSVSRLAKNTRAWSSIATAIALLVASTLAAPASSAAGPRARRAAKAAAKVAPQLATNPSDASSQPTQPGQARPDSMSGRPGKMGQYNPQDETVDMFEAMEAGQIAVRFIPKDSTQGRMFIKNKTDKPLNVRLPEAFAATQVLAQMGMGGMGMGGMGAGGGGGQGMGGGGGGGNMGGGGMFNVPAEKEGNLKVPCVCLEHGKAEPRPQMTYTIKPIQSFTTKPGVAQMLKELGHHRIDQRSAQAAAWHLNNGMTWEQLASETIERADGSSYPYFAPQELQAGMQIAEEALAASKTDDQDRQDSPKKPSPGETAANGR
ncbi:MAG TPA: hypothetical protein VG826_30705 [Pirellulales bacterium]|nr:hypothetical protein [Pirellulales bacterium]